MSEFLPTGPNSVSIRIKTVVERAWHYRPREYAAHQPNLKLWVLGLKAFEVRTLADADSRRDSIDCTVDQESDLFEIPRWFRAHLFDAFFRTQASFPPPSSSASSSRPACRSLHERGTAGALHWNDWPAPRRIV